MTSTPTREEALARMEAELERRYAGPGLLASPWFWIGGAVSALIWIVICHLIRSYFA